MFCSFFGHLLLMFCSFFARSRFGCSFFGRFFKSCFGRGLVSFSPSFGHCLVDFCRFCIPFTKTTKNYQKRPNNDQQNDQIMTKKRQKHDQPNLERVGTWPKNDQQMSRQLATKSRMTKKQPKNEQGNWQKNEQIILVIYPSLRLQRSHKSKEMAGRLLIWCLGYPVLATGIHDNSWLHA